MRKGFSLLLILSLFSLSAFPQEYKAILQEIRQAGSVQNSLDFICQKSEREASILSDSNYSDLCRVVKESELCQDVPEDKKLLCDEIEENTINVFSFSFMYNCMKGLWNSIVNLFNFIVGMIKGTLGYAFDSEQRDKANEAMGEYYDSFKNYLALEFDKAREDSDTDLGAVMAVASDIIKKGANALAELINTEYKSLGCYRQEDRQERVCELVGDIIVPPAAAVGVIFKGPKFLKAFKDKVKKSEQEQKDTLELVSSDSKVLTREARDLSPEEMKSQNIKRLSDKMTATMKKKGGLGIAAPQVGQGLKLIAFRDSKGKTRIMGNPVIKNNSDATKSSFEGCLSLKGTLCSVERNKDVSIEYLDLNGKKQVETLSGRDAIVAQHETDHINGILFPFKSKAYGKKFKLKNAKDISPNGREKLGRFLHGLSKKEAKTLKSKYSKTFNEDLKGIDSPNSLAFSLKDVKGISTNDEVFNEILNFYAIGIKSSKSAEKFKKYDQWVKSDAHALYLYDRLSTLGHKEHSDLFRYLLTNNEYFKKAQPIRGPPGSPKGFVTYSFEKESGISDITLWFKKAGIDDEEWLELPEKERLRLIKKATNVKKDGVSESKIASTAFKPSYVGKYSQELNHSLFDRGYSWEIANKKYEIDIDRTMDQVREVSGFTGETHSIHSHVVFDMPKNYDQFEKFQTWAKQTNDYLYMRGLEEGLHGTYLTGLAHLPGEAPRRVNMLVGNSLPKSPGSVGKQSHKFFSMGIRGDLYGKSPIQGHKKMGLELRDTTRDLDQLNQDMHRISGSVSDYRWESIPDSVKARDLTLVRPNNKLIDQQLKDEVSDSFLKTLKEKKMTESSLPLLDYENGRYMDFSRGELSSLTQSQRKRIREAREYYINELKKIDRELIQASKDGTKFADEDIRMAIQMTVTEWANKAKVSEFFDKI